MERSDTKPRRTLCGCPDVLYRAIIDMKKKNRARAHEKSNPKPSLRERLARSVDLPLETVCNLSQIQIIGNREMVIEGYKGILEYDDNLLRIRVKGMCLSVWGSDLQLKCMNDENVIITGSLAQIEFLTESSRQQEGKEAHK